MGMKVNFMYGYGEGSSNPYLISDPLSFLGGSGDYNGGAWKTEKVFKIIH